MSLSILSTSGITLAGAMSASRSAWSSLGDNISQGDLSGAQASFSVYKRLVSNSANNLNSQFSSDMTDLSTALTTGDLTSAETAYEAVSEDVAGDPVLSINNAASYADQVGSWLSAMMGGSSSSTSSSILANPYAYILGTAYDQLDSATSSNASSYLSTVYGTDSSTSYLQMVYGSNTTGAADTVSSLLDTYA